MGTVLRRTRSGAAGIILAVGVAVAGCVPAGLSDPAGTPTPSKTVTVPSTASTAPEPTPQTPLGDPLESLSIAATGLDAPWSVAFTLGSALISERDSGRILERTAEGAMREVAVVDGMVSGGEGGLLGMTTHRGSLYVYFTATDGNRVVRFDLLGQPGALLLGESQTILAGLPAARTHNGGRLAIGPDGMLYVTVGDAENRGGAQDLGYAGGKILRLAPDGSIPADNPFPDSPVYSYGHRKTIG